jgi:zinc protease
VIDRATVPAPGAIRPFHFPRVERAVLSNGMTLLTAAHGAVPLVTARLVLDAGATREPLDMAGLAQLTAHTIDGGTTKRDAEGISWALESLGAHFDVGTGWDTMGLSVTAAADQMPQVLELLAEMVLDAQFPESEVRRVRNEQIGEIMQNRSDPRSLAAEMAVRFIYKPGATYGRTVLGDPTTVERLTRTEVQAFARTRCAPAGSALVLVGALDDRILSVAERCLAGWMNTLGPQSAATADARHAATAVHIVNRPGSVQSEIRIGHPGVTRTDPDYFALLVMNSILGGAFTSRLNMNLREKQGFTYGVQSSFAYRRARGPFVISTAVATDVTARAVEEILKDVNTLRSEGVTAEELSNTRDYLAGLLPLEAQTTEQVAVKLSELFAYTLPDDYFDDYRDGIARVTGADVLRVAQEHVRPQEFAIVVVGDAAQIETPLRALELGPLEVHSAND